jgi:hypothetical protein
MSVLLFVATAILSAAAAAQRTPGAKEGDAPSSATGKSGFLGVSLDSFAIGGVVLGAISFGASTFFKQRASRELRQAEEPLLVVGD